MATERKLRRGTAEGHQTFTGALGEITMVTDTNSIRVHDGSTPGGYDSILQSIAVNSNVPYEEVSYLELWAVEGVTIFFNATSKYTYVSDAPVTGTIGSIGLDVDGKLDITVDGSTVSLERAISSDDIKVTSEKIDTTTSNLVASMVFSKEVQLECCFKEVSDTVVTVGEVRVSVGDSVLVFPEGSVVALPTLTLGTDYAIYATDSGLVASDNFDLTTGRKVGGFHYGDSFIYPRSFWDLKFRPECDDPRGMVRSYMGFWADIYLLNTTPDLLGTSAYGAQIADDDSMPLKPGVWGGDGITDTYPSFTQYIATEVLAAYGKRSPTSAEFEVLALGSVAGHVRGTDPVITLFDADSRSHIGCEQVSGHLSQWGVEKWDRGDGSTGYAWRAEDTNGEGGIFGVGQSRGIGASLFGADWNDTGFSGARSSYWEIEPWYSFGNVAARGVCNHHSEL